jgi:hypothetical protein
MQTRRPILSLTLLLAVLSAMLFVRTIDPHWHRHLRPAEASVSGESSHASVHFHLADLASAHSPDELDQDVSLLGEQGSTLSISLDTPPIFALILLWLFAIDHGRLLLRAPMRARKPSYHRSGAPPPQRGPPLSN